MVYNNPCGRSWHEAWADFASRTLLYVLAVLGVLAILSSCAGKSALSPPPPPAVEVLVPVTRPCEVEQVAPSELQTANGAPADLFEAAKEVLADLLTLKADREKLVAANTRPCPMPENLLP